MSLLAVTDLSVTFVQYARGLRRQSLEVVTGLDLSVDAGELVAVVGASGSGKSLLAHSLLGLLPANARESGDLSFDGKPLTPARRRQLRGREIALIPQTVASLDPMATVGAQVRRAAEVAQHANPAEAAAQALAERRLDPDVEARYAHELSGGMARRVITAIALIGRPRLILADEPTPGLHPSIVAEALHTLRKLADDGAAVVLITHDLTGALTVADRVAVFYAGTTVELAPTSSFTGDGSKLLHPYSRALWRALPGNGFEALPGAQPSPLDLPAGCLFADRCPLVIHECTVSRPAPVRVGDTTARCIRINDRQAIEC